MPEAATRSQAEFDLVPLTNDSEQAKSAEPYDLVSGANLAHSRLPALGPTLERINDRFARQFRAALLQYLRRGITVTALPIELIPHRDLLKRLAEPSLFSLINMKPMRGSVLMVIDAALANALVEARFGGDGRFSNAAAKREFSGIEIKALERTLGVVLEQFAIAWEPFALFEPSVIRHETARQFASFGAPDDLVFVSAFDINIDSRGGTLLSCISDSNLEPLHNQLMTNIAEEGFNYDMHWYEMLKGNVERAEITLSAQLGTIELHVSDLLRLRPGDVFEMQRPDSVIVEAGDVPLFRGKWGRHGKKIAVMIEDRLDKDGETVDEQ